MKRPDPPQKAALAEHPSQRDSPASPIHGGGGGAGPNTPAALTSICPTLIHPNQPMANSSRKMAVPADGNDGEERGISGKGAKQKGQKMMESAGGGGRPNRPTQLFNLNNIGTPHGVSQFCFFHFKKYPFFQFSQSPATLQIGGSHSHPSLNFLPQTAMLKTRVCAPPPYSPSPTGQEAVPTTTTTMVGGTTHQKCQMCSPNSLGKQATKLVWEIKEE
jgi:hypothetical protein